MMPLLYVCNLITVCVQICAHSHVHVIVVILCIHIFFYYCTFAFRRFDVNGFGIWGCSTITIFVKKATDDEILKSELNTLNQNFFEKYHLKIEARNMVEKQTMRHYNSSMLKYIL